MSFSVREAAPPVSDIVGGSSFSDGGTIITIPAGRIWSGDLQLSAYATWMSEVTSDQLQAAPTITVQGTGAVPVSGSLVAHCYLVQVDFENPVVDRVAGHVVVAATTDPVTLRLNLQGASGATAIATGQLL